MHRRITVFLLLAAVACLAVGSLQPFDLGQRPLAWPGWHESPPDDLALNVAAYIPVGLCACMLLGRRLGGMAVAAAIGVGLSLMFECTQSMSAVRVASWIDVISNGLGTVLGTGLAAAFAKPEH